MLGTLDSVQRSHAPAALIAILMVALLSCSDGAPPPQKRVHTPLVVIGVDGADWGIIEDRWAAGGMPTFKRLVDGGIRAPLRTNYGKSPVIWTTIATGVGPERHGITNFVLAGDNGTKRATSLDRRVPAVWNIASALSRRVAVLGWWPSWPAEEVNGVMVTERAFEKVENWMSPPDFADRFAEMAAEADEREDLFAHEGAPLVSRRDRVLSHVAARLAGDETDLVMVYLRSTDLVCHWYWKYAFPEGFDDIPEDEMAAYAHVIPSIYEAVDDAVGRIIAGAGNDANVLIMSDHGFHALEQEKINVFLDLDKVLEACGLLSRNDDGGVDIEASVAYNFGSTDGVPKKRIHFGGGGSAVAEAKVRECLGGATFAGGAAAFEVSSPTAHTPEGIDLLATVQKQHATKELYVAGQPVAHAVNVITRVSGGHPDNPPGIFLAYGPAFAAGATLKDPSVMDMAPTMLVALGLPVAEDFFGRPLIEAFTPEFLAEHPVQSIPSWGDRKQIEVSATGDDNAEYIEQLRALGYLD